MQGLAKAAGCDRQRQLYQAARSRQLWIEAARDISTNLLAGDDPAVVHLEIAAKVAALTDSDWFAFLLTRTAPATWWSPHPPATNCKGAGCRPQEPPAVWRSIGCRCRSTTFTIWAVIRW